MGKKKGDWFSTPYHFMRNDDYVKIVCLCSHWIYIPYIMQNNIHVSLAEGLTYPTTSRLYPSSIPDGVLSFFFVIFFRVEWPVFTNGLSQRLYLFIWLFLDENKCIQFTNFRDRPQHRRSMSAVGAKCEKLYTPRIEGAQATLNSVRWA